MELNCREKLASGNLSNKERKHLLKLEKEAEKKESHSKKGRDHRVDSDEFEDTLGSLVL